MRTESRGKVHHGLRSREGGEAIRTQNRLKGRRAHRYASVMTTPVYRTVVSGLSDEEEELIRVDGKRLQQSTYGQLCEGERL